MKKGLILEGGAMRGMFTAGVIDVMMENGIEYDGGIGVSAGAAFGCNYKSKQIGRVIRYNTKYCQDWRYCSWRSWLVTGDLYGAEFCYKILPERLDKFDVEAFKKSPMEFYVVCTDVETAQPVYHKCTNGKDADLDWIRASASMPIVSHPVHIDGYALLDGGISDSIPLKYFEKIGYEKNVVVLTQPADYVKQPQSHPKALKTLLHKYPKVYQRLLHRHDEYNATLRFIKEEVNRGKAFVIQPPESLNIGSMEHDPNELKRVYQIGRRTAENQLEKLREYLNG